MNRFFTIILFLGVFANLDAATSRHRTPAVSNFHFKIPGVPGAPLWALPGTMGVDTVPPVIVCPPDEIINLGSGLCETVFSYTVTATDDSLVIVPNQWSGIASGGVFPIGTTMNAFVAEDSSGNTSDCSFTVTVVADTAALTCQDTVFVYLGTDCWVAPGAADLLEGNYGCVLSMLVEADRTVPLGDGPWGGAFFESVDRGKLYQYRVSDLLNGGSCIGFVRIFDTIPPALVCPTAVVPCLLPEAHLLPAFLRDTLGIQEGFPMITERCMGDVALNFVDVRNDYSCDSIGVAGIITRFWTALDASNNVATCVQTIVRERSVDDVYFPFDGTFECTPMPSPAVTGWPFIDIGGLQYFLTDTSSCGLVAEFIETEQVFCGANRLINRLWTVQDGCLPDSLANPLVGEQILEILDGLEPVLHCPLDTVAVLGGADCVGMVNLPDIIVEDACSYLTSVVVYWDINGTEDSLSAVLDDFIGNNTSHPDTLAVFGEAPGFMVGATTLRIVATDACGNTSECEMELLVWDSIPPLAQCDTFLTAYLNDLGLATMPAGLFDEGSMDACSQVFFKARRVEAGTCDTLGGAWDDYVYLCCADLGDTVSVALRVYDIPVPAGAVSDSLAQGQYSDCTAPILILDINSPQCTAPMDTVVTCENFDPSFSAYGFASTSCTVDSTAMLINYQQFDTVCSRGTIARTFRVFDAGGTSGQCTQQIVVENEQRYFVRFPDDLVIMACDTSGSYGAPAFFGTGCENMVASFVEATVFNVPDACFRIERTWKIYNACAYDSSQALIAVPNPDPNALAVHPDNQPGPVVSEAGTVGDWAPTLSKIGPNDLTPTDFSTFWAVHANGYTYKQIIRVIDLEQPIVEDCPAGAPIFVDLSDNDLHLWNANFSADPGNPNEDLCEGVADLEVTVTDACFGPNLGVDYLLFLDLDGDDVQESVVNSTDLPLPGTILFNNVNTPNYAGGQLRQYDTRPVGQNARYQFVLRADTVGRRQVVRLVWHIPATPGSDTPLQLPLGNHRIQWTVYDNCGNETTCAYNFRVEDPDGTCAPTVLTVGGTVKTETGAGIPGVAVELNGTHPVLPPFTQFALTDAQGAFSFTLPASSSYTLKPFRDDNPLNGVSTFDLLLINKHVLGLEAIPSPYRTLAADANKSNTVTTFDIVEFRKLILGLYQQLPALPSWRFVAANHIFSNPANPFSGGFPEQIDVTNLQASALPVQNFIGFKVGDVNGNTNPNFAGVVVEDRNRPVLYLDVSDHLVTAGDVVRVRVRADKSVAGMQFTLNYPGLEVLDLIPGAGLSDEQFVIFNIENSLAVSWETGGLLEFVLRFRVLESGSLREKLQLSNRIARSEAYSADLSLMQVALRFGDNTVSVAGFELFQNQPNPFDAATSIGFYLPEVKTATLRLWDSAGRLLWETTQAYPAGNHAITVESHLLGAGIGLLYYQLETDTDRAVRKMLRF